jgi:hypothetical protein
MDISKIYWRDILSKYFCVQANSPQTEFCFQVEYVSIRYPRFRHVLLLLGFFSNFWININLLYFN